ncbi:MAG: UvrD-helicase domain-containing protein [Flavobacteriales bacterium]
MIKPSTLKIYNASAGSGKTYTLVKEYLLIILGTNDYYRFSNILAITFTNKAAAEMKDRIIEALKEFSSKNLSNQENDLFKTLCHDLQIKPEQLRERAQKTLSRILHQYSTFSVSTIDKFTHRLIRSFSQDLGLSSNFEVEMDADKLLHESVEVLLSKLGKDSKITPLLLHYALSKLDEDKSWNISSDLTDIAKILLKEDHQGYIKNLKTHTVEDFVELKNRIIKQQQAIKKQLTLFSTSFFNLLNNNAISPTSFAHQDLPNFFGKFNQPDLSKIIIGTRLQKQLDSQKFYSNSTDSEQMVKIDTVFNPIKNIIHSATTFLEENKPTYFLNQLILQTVSSLTVINEIEKELTFLKEENNILLNSEFNKIISEEIKNQPAPYIYERIGEKYNHYFIDEFQDTSVLQWQNLKPLIENQLAQSGNALIVGDSKQSIYRWRGGDPEQFINLSENGDGLPFRTENLNTNYRSFKEIIQFNNQFYQNASKSFENESYKDLYQTTTNQLTNNKENGFIEIHLIEKSKNSDYNQIQLDYVLHTIQSLHKEGFKYKEITVLVRYNKHGIKIAQHLIKNEIPIVSKESLLLKNSIEIQLIEKILRIIHTENDFKTRAEFLMQLHQNNILFIEEDLHSFIKKTIPLPLHLFFKQLEKSALFFDLKEARSKSLYGLVEYCYRQFRLIQKGKNAYIQYFLDFVLTYTSKKSNDLDNFLLYWNEKKEKESIVMPNENDAVQIMTIHKSKGLQFPVVILPYTDWNAFSDNNAYVWIPLENEHNKVFDYFYVPAGKNLSEGNSIGKKIIDQNNNQIQLDNLNVLYVATTRAVERLYIATLHQKKTEKSSIAYYFNDYLNQKNIPKPEQFLYQQGSKERVVNSDIPKPIIPIQFYSNEWKSILEINKTAPLFWNTEETSALEYGNRIHHILSKIEYEEETDFVLNHFLSIGSISKKDFEVTQRKIKEIIQTESLAPYFKRDYKIFNEREIYFNHQILRPDRVIVKGKYAVLIDYKTGKQHPQDKTQVQQYADALKNLGYIVQKKLLVYIHKTTQIIELK